MIDFIASILPTRGHLCVVEQVPSDPKPIMKHHWVSDIESLCRKVKDLDAAPNQIFIAQAAFIESGSLFKGRGKDRVEALKNFFLDIDCGAGKPYADQRAGADALKAFCLKIEMPLPSIVSSGNGLYAHWKLTEDIPVPMWNSAAHLLKRVVNALEPKLDADSIICDAARILRPVGATHRKNADMPKRVLLLSNSQPIRSTEFVKILLQACKTHHIKDTNKQKVDNLNSVFMIEQDGIPSSAEKIAHKCAQIAYIKETKGNVPEPMWYAAVGLLRYTQEAPDVVHEWSKGHPDYTADATDAKIAQHEKANIGPTTCAHFASLTEFCAGCVHASKITTPLLLGRSAPEPLKADEVPAEDALPDPPKGFTVSKAGVHYVADDSSTPVLCYPYPLYITAINSDFFGESVTIKHYLPHEGWAETVIPSSTTQDSKKFFSLLLDNHIHIIGREQKGLFMSYFELFMSKVRAAGQINQLANSMGWHGEDGDLTFTHGAETYRRDGTTTSIGYSSAAPDWVRALQPKGGIQEWVENTRILNTEGLEGLAFEFLVAAFGSPLVRFTGYSGAMVSVVGDSGVGKTITGKWGLSAWGHPEKLALMRDDTRNALLNRLGVYGSLPAYIDEVSNIPNEELSEIIYRITQGREKIRLDKSAKERKNINTWQMLAVVSSNHSLMDKISNLKGDAAGELNRVFEYEVYAGYDKPVAQNIIRTCTDNYGQVGKSYAKYLVENQRSHQSKLDELSIYIDKRSDAEAGERFWTMIGAVAIYGGTIAHKLGLSHVDVPRLVPWICDKITEMRRYKKTHTFDAVSWLGAFFDRHVSDFVVLKSYVPNSEFGAINHQREPRARLIGRIEEDRMLMWVSVDAIRRELNKESISFRKLTQLLKSTAGGSILNGTRRMTLGKGTVYSGVVQNCWELNLNHPELGHKFMVSVKNAEDKEKHTKRGSR